MAVVAVRGGSSACVACCSRQRKVSWLKERGIGKEQRGSHHSWLRFTAEGEKREGETMLQSSSADVLFNSLEARRCTQFAGSKTSSRHYFVE
nr:hypothetical protein Itr_chr03CG07870 [Ipomoea trifida]